MLICRDAQCESHYPGSPLSVPLHVTVIPNIYMQREISLARREDDAASVLRIPVEVPAAAGPVEVSLRGRNDAPALSARFVDGAIEISAQRMRAGTYQAVLSIASVRDPRLHAQATLICVVSAAG